MVALGRVLATGDHRLRRLSDREEVPLTGRYRGLVIPLLLIGIGVVVLLANLGYLTWDAALRLVDLWPVLLILIGIQIIASRLLPAAAAAATGTAAVALALIGAIAYLALVPPLPSASRSDFSDPVQGISRATLAVDLNAVRLNLQGAALESDLYEAHFDFPAGESPRAALDRGAAIVHVDSTGSGFGWPRFGARREATIRLNDSVAWRIRVNTGASNQVFDLSRLQLTELAIDGGASYVDVTLPSPAGQIAVTITGGADNVLVHRPRGSAVRVQVAGGASTLVADGNRVSGRHDLTWENGYASASDRYNVRVEGGASQVTLDTR